MTGGGSGGHITPILAVAHELKRLRPDAEIIYIGQKGDKLSDIPAGDPNIDVVHEVSAGKLRRYDDEGWRQWLNLRVQFLNVRDVFRVLAGIWQSYWLLRKERPAVIFTRGGFVSVPVAIGGHLNGIPFVTHDSDSVPSLANRLIARWAHTHAVALPVELYPYPKSKTVMVGVPVSAKYEPVDDKLRREYREALGLEYKQIVFLTGGGNGARMLNEALAANARYLLGTFPDLALVHVAGRALEAETNAAYDALKLGAARGRVFVHGFVTDLYRYSGAADVVIARGGATNLAEFAQQGAACLIVPSKQLGWNVKNAAALASRGAVLQLSEDQAEQPERLGRTIGELLEDDGKRAALGRKLAAYAHPLAAVELAGLVLNVADGGAGHAVPEK
ncbi:MAG TPA: glycosyltransferase [Candidatus Saccharimonadales bacterium]|nr:glycosyltransferase [Candidatus Saccharimonadales bacterium]